MHVVGIHQEDVLAVLAGEHGEKAFDLAGKRATLCSDPGSVQGGELEVPKSSVSEELGKHVAAVVGGIGGVIDRLPRFVSKCAVRRTSSRPLLWMGVTGKMILSRVPGPAETDVVVGLRQEPQAFGGIVVPDLSAGGRFLKDLLEGVLEFFEVEKVSQAAQHALRPFAGRPISATFRPKRAL